MKAIISDIHGNLEALDAVLADIRNRDIDEIVCLGDVVGYGPNPRECLDRIMEANVLIMGNHEEAVLGGQIQGFNPRARKAIEWTMNELWGPGIDPGRADRYRQFMSGFLREWRDDQGAVYVHGSPRDPTREYIVQRDAGTDKIGAILGMIETVCFVGHSHVPGVFTEGGYSTPAELFNIFMVSGQKAIVNVGSVGQPRDGDPRAGYATFEVDTVVFHRVDYDIDAVVAKFQANEALDGYLGERLKTGR